MNKDSDKKKAKKQQADPHYDLQDVVLKCGDCGAEAYVYKGHGRLSKVTCTYCGKTGRVKLKEGQGLD